MTTLQALILGIVEGLTEFLPVSSTGHLIIAARLLHIADTPFLKSFEIAIQLGAILAVVALYWRRLFKDRQRFAAVVIAFIPTGIIGLLAYKTVKTYLLGNATVTALALIVGGVALIVFEWWLARHPRAGTVRVPTPKQSVVVGIAQTAAFVPGVSRSAAAIIGGMLAGLSRAAVVEFSFLLSVPTMAAATGLDLLKSGHDFSGGEITMLLVGAAAAFVVALAAIRFFLRYLERHTFSAFGIYRIVIGLAFLAVVR